MTSSAASVVNVGSHFRLRWVTSSTMPTVKCRLGLAAASSSKTAGDHRRRELLGRQAVAAADDLGGWHVARPLAPALDECRDDVLVERLADGAGLLGAVEHGDSLLWSPAAPRGSSARRTDGRGGP